MGCHSPIAPMVGGTVPNPTDHKFVARREPTSRYFPTSPCGGLQHSTGLKIETWKIIRLFVDTVLKSK